LFFYFLTTAHLLLQLDVTVKYIDDKTGNVASAKWNKLDKATQDQIRGGGRILSVIVPGLIYQWLLF
jgi:hypothetical protein